MLLLVTKSSSYLLTSPWDILEPVTSSQNARFQHTLCWAKTSGSVHHQSIEHSEDVLEEWTLAMWLAWPPHRTARWAHHCIMSTQGSTMHLSSQGTLGQALLPSLQTFPEFFFLLVTNNKRVLSIPYMDKLKYHALKKPKAIALEIKISRQLHSQVRQLQASLPSRPPLD